MVIARPVSASVAGPLGVDGAAVRRGTCTSAKRHLGDVQHRVEDRGARRGHRGRPATTNTPAGGHHRQPVGPVTVEHVARGAVQPPAVAVARAVTPS